VNDATIFYGGKNISPRQIAIKGNENERAIS